jgi:hypothetical protein
LSRCPSAATEVRLEENQLGQNEKPPPTSGGYSFAAEVYAITASVILIRIQGLQLIPAMLVSWHPACAGRLR